MSTTTDVDWAAFADWLVRKGLSSGYVKSCVSYSKLFGECLFSGDVSRVVGCSAEQHVMAALSNLSRFLGKYDEWKKMMERSGLVWKGASSESVFFRLYEGKESVSDVEAWADSLIGFDDGERRIRDTGNDDGERDYTGVRM